MKTIDIHTHVSPEYAGLAVEVMDRCGVEKAAVLAWHDGFGDGLRPYLAMAEKFPGRFAVFGNIDFSAINRPDFGKSAAARMEKDAAAGMAGLKVYKALGLEYRREDGSLWRVDATELHPIWEKAGELGIPVLIHTADPEFFWRPVDARNFWDGVLHGEYGWWSYYRKGLPSTEELISERNEVVGAFGKTVFICPHVGSRSESLDSAAEDLDSHPNMCYDISARIPELGRSERRRDHAREFIIAYQDRILFGTDMIYDGASVPHGIQAQCLFQPGEIRLRGKSPEVSYADTSVRFFESHMKFLLGRDVQRDPPFRRSRSPYEIFGLGLPEDVVRKIVWENAEMLLNRNSPGDANDDAEP